jgi:hypothetical protein
MEVRTLEHLLAIVEGDAHDYVPTEAERQLATELIALEQEEEDVSAFRRRLHDRLASFPNPETEAKEREVSTRRSELHSQIDARRAELAELGWIRTTESKGRTGRRL